MMAGCDQNDACPPSVGFDPGREGRPVGQVGVAGYELLAPVGIDVYDREAHAVSPGKVREGAMGDVLHLDAVDAAARAGVEQVDEESAVERRILDRVECRREQGGLAGSRPHGDEVVRGTDVVEAPERPPSAVDAGDLAPAGVGRDWEKPRARASAAHQAAAVARRATPAAAAAACSHLRPGRLATRRRSRSWITAAAEG